MHDPLDAIAHAHRAVRQILIEVTWKSRRNANRAALAALGHETLASLSVALIVRPNRRPAALADAREDLSSFARLAGRLDPNFAVPITALLTDFPRQ